MQRNWLKLGIVPLLAAVWSVGCSDRGAAPERVLGPEAAALSVAPGTWSSAQKEELKKVYAAMKIEAFPKAAKYDISGWNLVVGNVGSPKSALKIVEPSGAEIDINGHKLIIPAGAVSTPTVFRMRLFPAAASDGTGVVGVELRAVSVDPSLKWVDVGSGGFDVPVRLRLTYAIATNLSQSSAKKLQILWLKSGKTAETTSRVGLELTEKYIISELNHFSDYALAFP